MPATLSDCVPNSAHTVNSEAVNSDDADHYDKMTRRGDHSDNVNPYDPVIMTTLTKLTQSMLENYHDY